MNEPITVADAEAARRALQDEILSRVRVFEERTGMRAIAAEFSRGYPDGVRGVTTQVLVTAVLP